MFWYKKRSSVPSNPTKDLTMRQVLKVSKPTRLPRWKQWKQLPSVLSRMEKRIMQSAFVVMVVSTSFLIGLTLLSRRVEIPTKGGEYTEALVGEPQLINPLYAISNDVDQDLTSLIYSGLFRWIPDRGLVNDLAQSIHVNEEGTVITIKIRENATFHNGDPVRARDILFTINAIQNPSYRSSLLPIFKNISVIQEDDLTVSFILPKADTPFLQNLTVGILPSGVWADVLPQNAPLASLNLQPIGSGPYQFVEFTKDKKGSIRSYTLEPFNRYSENPAKIERLIFKFYPDSDSALDGLTNKFVEGMNVVPFKNLDEVGQNRTVVLHSPFLSRETILFFNQKINPLLEKKGVREAIAKSIDKQTIVQTILSGNGRVIEGPILKESLGYHAGLEPLTVDLEAAKTLLTENGVLTEPKEESTKKPNQFTLTTIDSEEFLQVANYLKTQLEQIGLEIEIVSFANEVFYEKVIAPRNFELLLTTVLFNADPDPSIFWHSNKADGAGLNIVDYKNPEVDKLLDSARTTLHEADRQMTYQTFQEKLAADLPAVFLYQSTYSYALPKKIEQAQFTQIRIPSDRFAKITEWYIKTKKSFK